MNAFVCLLFVSVRTPKQFLVLLYMGFCVFFDVSNEHLSQYSSLLSCGGNYRVALVTVFVTILASNPFTWETVWAYLH